ncbi:MAG: 6-bladed beta-propeller [Gemmatimonadota bacterium]
MRDAVLTSLVLLAAACDSGPAVDATCSDCAIQLERLVTIGEGTGEGALDDQAGHMVRDDRGRWLVLSHTQALPYIYDSTGAYAGRLGSEGEGPGEFVRPRGVVAGNDSVYVFDAATGKLQVFDGDLSFARAVSGPVRFNMAVMVGGGRFVANTLPPGRPPLALYGPGGTELASFGDTVSGADPGTAYLHRPRVLARARSGGVWSAKQFFDPILRRWSRDGELVEEIPLSLSWYEPYETIENLNPDRRPWSTINGIWEDESGRVWIVGLSADDDWAEGLGEPVGGEGRQRVHPVEDPDRVFDTFITAIDPLRTRDGEGGVLFERRLDGAYAGTGPGLITTPTTDDLGFQSRTVYRVRLAE